MTILTALFFVTAFIYALIGFGGGSTYNSLLVLADVDFRILPTITLACNLIVVSGGVWHHSRAGNLSRRIVVPFIVASIPMAWIGGMISLSEQTFVWLLGSTLLLTGARMLFSLSQSVSEQPMPRKWIRWAIGLPVGASLGLLAGMVGIGGGVFLAPILQTLRWGSARNAAAAASLFILVNSAAGILGQTVKLAAAQQLDMLSGYLWLFPAVLIGGQIGSHLSAYHLPEILIRRLTAVLIIYVAARLLFRGLVM